MRAGPASRGTPGHGAARRHLTHGYAEIGLTSYGPRFELPYTLDGQRFTNLAAVAPGGGAHEAAPVLIAAHYDTVPQSPGANFHALQSTGTMRAALAPLLERLGVRVETRSDIERVAAALMQQCML